MSLFQPVLHDWCNKGCGMCYPVCGMMHIFYMHHLTDRIAHTMAIVTPVVEHWLEREIVQWVHPMKDRSDDPRTLLPQSYIFLPFPH